MKIKSYDMQMQSHHLAYKSMLESTLEFESFITDEEVQNNLKRFDYDKSRTLHEIIQSLFTMLSKRIQSSTQIEPLDKKDVIGYTHMHSYKKYEEFESVDIQTQGCIQTDQGTIQLDLQFSMSRNFVIENRIDIYTPFDPLVISLDGSLPQLSETSFSFDLDNDGKKEQISQLENGSGFLVYDKNKDGKITQGNELFGTQKGDGFEELAYYDKDGNAWIDESDSIFDKLQIWLKNDATKERELIGLGEAGIGAIYLGSTESRFYYKTQANQTLGEMKNSGIFLGENGMVGTVAEIDFNIAKKGDYLGKLLQG